MKIFRALGFLALAAFLSGLPAKAQVYQAGGGINEYSGTDYETLTSSPIANGGDAESVVYNDGILYIYGWDSTDTHMVVGTYNAATLAPINPVIASFDPITPFATGAYPGQVAVSGNNIYLGNSEFYAGYVTEVNSVTGAVDQQFISLPSNNVAGLVVDNGILYVSSNSGTVATYNAATGALLDSNFITFADGGNGGSLAIYGNSIYVVDAYGAPDYNNVLVGEYDLATGDPIDASFLSGADGTTDQINNIALNGSTLYVEDNTNNTLGAYDPTTGHYEGDVGGISTRGQFGVYGSSDGLVDDNPPSDAAPEPRSWAMASIVGLGFLALWRRRSVSGLV